MENGLELQKLETNQTITIEQSKLKLELITKVAQLLREHSKTNNNTDNSNNTYDKSMEILQMKNELEKTFHTEINTEIHKLQLNLENDMTENILKNVLNAKKNNYVDNGNNGE